MFHLPRLVFLAAKHSPVLPRIILRWLPQSDLIKQVAKVGIAGAHVELGVEATQLQKLFEKGAKEGAGTLEEFKILVANVCVEELELSKEELSFSKFMQSFASIHKWLESERDLVGYAEASLLDPGEIPEQIKWDTGFDPLDLVTGGLYQGIWTFIGRPGDGKTTMFLTFMEELRKSNAASSVWLFETEIPMNLMLYRAQPILKRTKFVEDDRIITGLTPVEEIIDRLDADPDPERVIIYDSPDVLAAGGESDQRRFVLEEIYRNLVRVKSRCKAVLTASQPRRKDRYLSLESVAESWAKAWYSDGVITLGKAGGTPGSFETVQLRVVKNRFGISGQDLKFQYHFGSLEWHAPHLAGGAWGEDEDW